MTGRTFLSSTADGVGRLVGGSGEEWTVETHLEGVRIHAVAAGPPGSGIVLAGGEEGVFRSADRGATWEPRGLEDEVVRSVAVAPDDSACCYAGVRPPGVYRSDDGGDAWTECESFQGVRGRRMWRSPASAPFTAYVQALAVSPADPGLVVAGVEFGAVVRSADGGETWVKPGGGLDRGYGWAVAAHPADADVWYVSASTGPTAAHGDGDAEATVFRHDGGESWTELDSFPGERMPYALCTDPDLPDHLWAGRADGSVWRSFDRGRTWDRLGGELPAVDGSMAMLPPD